MWFEALTGFDEESPDQVRANITVDSDVLISHTNGRRLTCGVLEMPTLAELRDRVQSIPHKPGNFRVRQVVADAQHLHSDEINAGSLFQVASQFNLLEMISPNDTPEDGIGIYENDRTQGPACAIAAGAGTIYRNYFAPVNGQTGQSSTNQIDCLSDLGVALGNTNGCLWEMRNGYALASESGLIEIAERIHNSDENERNRLRSLLRIGIQWNTQVTLNDAKHNVSQAFCSALPVAYSRHPSTLWENFAELILEAAYEATFCAAILNSLKTGNHSLFLTLLGGGAFGNETTWIIKGIKRAIEKYEDYALDVVIVSYGSPSPSIQQLET